MSTDQPGLLFHGTSIYCLAAIAQTNRLDEGAHWGKRNEPHGPRLTRDWGQAEGFIVYANPELCQGGIVVLDRAALEANYRLQAYVDTYYEGPGQGKDLGANEAEEVVLTPSIDPLHTCLRSWVCDPAVLEAARDPETMAFAQDTGGWPFDDGEAGHAQALEALDVLASSPYLNAWMPATGYPEPGFPEDKARQAKALLKEEAVPAKRRRRQP